MIPDIQPPAGKGSLLDEGLLRVHLRGNPEPRLSLPGLLARLGAGEPVELTALRPHQQHAWHAFVVQLAALVLELRADRKIDLDAETWRETLADLGGSEEAWTIVVEDLAKPAFLQPPVADGDLAKFKAVIETPDDLDVLITSKNHDVKRSTAAASAQWDDWVLALVTLQTTQGFLGRGNYGIARMNGGFSSRPCLSAAPGLGSGERFRRDVALWLDRRPRLIEDYGFAPNDGAALLWTVPWDGASEAIAGGSTGPLGGLDPFFIEVCRRIRLQFGPQQRLRARFAPTQSAFLDAKELSGNTGDVWNVVDNEGKALTASPATFSYRKLPAILFGDEFARRTAIELRPEDGAEPIFLGQAFVRGQGTTEGWHERRLPIPSGRRSGLMEIVERARLGNLAEQMIDAAGRAERRVLKPALCTLLQGAPESLDFKDDRPQRWIDRMDAQVDAIFFDHLWRLADESTSGDEQIAGLATWEKTLVDLAREQLNDAFDSAPIPSSRRLKARAIAENVFWGSARKQLQEAFFEPASQPDAGESNA